MAKKLRIDKVLSNIGCGSRAEIKKYCKQSLIKVNGKVVSNPGLQVDPENDEIIFDGEVVKYREFVYIMLNKPDGVVSATYDPHKETVIDLVSEYAKQKVFPVGRLDIDTEGLLLITNDGMLCHELLSPIKHVDKKYYVEFSGEFKEEYYQAFENGITLDDGYVTLPGKINIIGDNKAEVTIHEGKFHQVKRMFLALNMEVTYLKRISFGSLVLDNTLKLGDYRLLSEKEVEDLKR